MTELAKDPRYQFSPGDKGRAEIMSFIEDTVEDIRGRMPDAFETLVPGFLEVTRIDPSVEAGAPGAYGGAGSVDGTKPGHFWINLRSTDLHNKFDGLYMRSKSRMNLAFMRTRLQGGLAICNRSAFGLAALLWIRGFMRKAGHASKPMNGLLKITAPTPMQCAGKLTAIARGPDRLAAIRLAIRRLTACAIKLKKNSAQNMISAALMMRLFWAAPCQ